MLIRIPSWPCSFSWKYTAFISMCDLLSVADICCSIQFTRPNRILGASCQSDHYVSPCSLTLCLNYLNFVLLTSWQLSPHVLMYCLSLLLLYHAVSTLHPTGESHVSLQAILIVCNSKVKRVRESLNLTSESIVPNPGITLCQYQLYLLAALS